MPETRIKGINIADATVTEADISLVSASVVSPIAAYSFVMWDTVNAVLKTSPLANVEDYFDTKYSLLGHTHDSRYYTETEIDNLLANYQPLDSDLTAIAALTGTGYLYRSAFTGWSLETISGGDSYDGFIFNQLLIGGINDTSGYQGIQISQGSGITVTGTSQVIGGYSCNVLTIANSAPFPGFGTTSSTAARGNHTHIEYLTSIPIASASVLGGIKVGSGLSIDGNGVLSTSGGGGSGTVTSVGLSMPTGFSVSNSPITTNGTISVSLSSQTKNKFLGSPATATGTPTFRTLVAADIPALSYDNYEAWYCNGSSIFSKNATLFQGQYNGVDFIEGTGVTINSQSSPDGSKLRLTFSASGGGGGSTINFYNSTNNGTVNLTSGSWVDICTHSPLELGEFILNAHATFNKDSTTAAVLGLRIVSIINGITNVIAATEQYVPSTTTNRNNLAITGYFITKGTYSSHEFKLQAYASTTSWTVVGTTPSTSQPSGIRMNVLHKIA